MYNMYVNMYTYVYVCVYVFLIMMFSVNKLMLGPPGPRYLKSIISVYSLSGNFTCIIYMYIYVCIYNSCAWSFVVRVTDPTTALTTVQKIEIDKTTKNQRLFKKT